MYHPIAEELSAFMGMPTKGFFDGGDTSFVTPPPSAATHGVPTEAPTSPTGPVPIEEGTHTGKVGEATVIPAETPVSEKKITPLAAIQTEATPVTPLVISTSDSFAALSQAIKDGSSLVMTPSSIPSSTTCGPDADLSSEGSEDILEDPEDEPVLKKRISDSDKEEGAAPKTEFMGMCFLLPLLPFFFFFAKFHLALFVCICVTLLLWSLSLFVCPFLCLQRPLKGSELQQT